MVGQTESARFQTTLRSGNTATPKVAFLRRLAFWLIATGVFASYAQANSGPAHDAGWVATWATASKVQSPFDPPTPPLNNVTLRQIVSTSVGGQQLRVWLTNEFGTEPLVVGAATVARLQSPGVHEPASLATLTFGGKPTITIAPGAKVVSDPASVAVANLEQLAVNIHLPQDLSLQSSPASYHVRALQTSYIALGDQTSATTLDNPETTTAWFYLAAVDILPMQSVPVIAAYGDSITDGDQMAALEPVDENARYTDFLARKLLLNDSPAAVINLGISGNQVTASFVGENMQARLDRDVFAQTGVSQIIVLGGINDIGLPVLLGGAATPAETIIAGHQQIAARAKAQGLEVIGGTLTPSGSVALPGYNSAETQAIRNEVNQWIRQSGNYDRVADFDRALRDPSNPGVMREDLTADGLHPNSAGYEVMADTVVRALAATTVEGQAFTDTNGDGYIDAGEPGEAGLMFTLFFCKPPYGVAGTAVSAPDGRFTFNNVDPGEYQIGVALNGRSVSQTRMGEAQANQFYANGFTNCANAPGPIVGAGFMP